MAVGRSACVQDTWQVALWGGEHLLGAVCENASAWHQAGVWCGVRWSWQVQRQGGSKRCLAESLWRGP